MGYEKKKPEGRKLLPSQFKDVQTALKEAGLNPNDFSRSGVKSRHLNAWVDVLSYGNTAFFYKFDQDYDSTTGNYIHRSEFSPGKETTRAYGGARTWED